MNVMPHSLIEKIIYMLLHIHQLTTKTPVNNTCENKIIYLLLHNRCQFTKKKPVITPVKTNFFKRPSSFLQYRNSLAAQFICILPFRSPSVSYNKCEGPVPVIGSEEMSFSVKLQNPYIVYNHYNVFTLHA